jgi:hypothetical protein
MFYDGASSAEDIAKSVTCLGLFGGDWRRTGSVLCRRRKLFGAEVEPWCHRGQYHNAVACGSVVVPSGVR